MNSQSLKLGFLASGGGSSARAIVDAIATGDLAAEARLMVSNQRKAPALAWAAERGLPALCVPTMAEPEAADVRLLAALRDHGVELVVLSGYMRPLGRQTLEAYAGRVINIHPGPLPRFGGQGMYGSRVHEAVIAAGVSESAIVIHVVDEEYDHGPELTRRSVPVAAGDTAQDLEARVRALEPGFFVETLQRIATGTLALPKGPPYISHNIP